ncbi:hypothetical protein ACTFIZ_012717 [Dictyostelium cf. discoideum]
MDSCLEFKIPIIMTQHDKNLFGEIVEPLRYDEKRNLSLSPSLSSSPSFSSSSSLSIVKVFDKITYSMYTKELVEYVNENLPNLKSVILTGLESHVCILQTALDLLENGYEVHVIDDAVASVQPKEFKSSLKRMKQSGVFLTSTESVIYQILLNDCIRYLGNKIGDPTLKDSQSSTFCSNTNYCNSNGSLIFLPINALFTNYSIPRSDLDCLPFLNSIRASNVYLDSNFLYETGIPNITEIYILNSNIQTIDGILTPFSNFNINSLSNNPLKLTYLQNVVNFGTISLISLEASGDQSKSKLTQIEVLVNELPDFSTTKLGLKILKIHPGPSFNDQTLTNIKSLTSLTEFFIISSDTSPPEIEFPYDIVSLKDLNVLHIDNKLKATNKLIDLSGNIITTVYLYLHGSNFNYNGEFPFSSMSKNYMNRFVYNKGNLTKLPDLKIFTNLSILEISQSNVGGTIPMKEPSWALNILYFYNNKLTGTIDESWCNSSQLYVNDNELNGSLPKCIYCFLSDPIISKNFINNNFNNFNTSSTCSYDDGIYISKISGAPKQLGISGKNLGYNTLNIKSTPESKDFTLLRSGGYIGSYLVPIDLNIVKFVEIRLLVPGLNFTVSTGNFEPNIINSNQSNNNIQISGEFFSYDKSSIIVTIGDNTNCKVLKSTFYDIQCDLGYPVKLNGDYILLVNVSGLLDSFQMNIKKTVYQCSPNDCNGRGTCDQDTGICNCDIKYTSIDSNNICSIPNHYISSSSQVLASTGGIIELNGWFGDIHSLKQLIINGNDYTLSIIKINSSIITVGIGSGNLGPVNVNYTQNGFIWTGVIYPYYSNIKVCPNNCNFDLNQGICNSLTGNCDCKPGYTGFDCKLTIDIDAPSSETNVTNNGSTIITNQDIQFLISIDFIEEIDFNSNTVEIFNLTNNWIFNNKINSITTFKQTLLNNITQLSLVIEEVDEFDKTFNFANNVFTILKGGFKMSISIMDWLFKSNLNTLNIQLSTDITTQLLNNNNEKCNQDTQIESFGGGSDNKILNGINYLKVSKVGKILYGRFQDKMLSDGRENIIITKIISNDDKSVKVLLNLPHCTECLIDPDFSLLVNPNFDSTCKDDDSRKWVIPVAVVVSVVGATVIVIICFIIYKKSTFMKVQVHKLKRFDKN